MMSSASQRSRRVTVRRKALMLSCATLAMATAALAPQRANAQAFNGTISTSIGATQTSVGPGTETITVNNSGATIDWAPNNSGTGTIDFLPTGNVATFTSSPGITYYTVINRIVPSDATRAISLNGTVLSTLEGTATNGGNIWFYSPGGIVIGATAVFDVGGLLLTTNNITSFGSAPSGFNVTFGPGSSTSKVEILDGAQINALQQNSYVALVAPRIEQGGNVQVNGSAAYVAAESLTMTMDQGLFDIAVDILGGGTDDVNGIVHTGTTGGPASTGAGDNHVIYMAAVPKNQALSMLLSGNVGYAASATVENGQIVLTAGWTPVDIAGGLSYTSPDSSLDAGMQILGGNFTSVVTAFGNSDMLAGTYDSALSFANGIDITSNDGSAELNASAGSLLEVVGNASLVSWGGPAGNALISATGGGSVDISGGAGLQVLAAAGGAAQGGNANVVADGGAITIGGIINADVSVYDSGPNLDGTSNDTQGGSIVIQAINGGGITAGSILANASASGANTTGGGDGIAGNGTGGTIEIAAESGGTIDVLDTLTANADGYGGAVNGAGTSSGYGQGGEVVLLGDGGEIAVGGNTYLSVNGSGGSVDTASVAGGAGYGGWAHVETWSADASILFGGDIFINAAGIGGAGLGGGSGLGGSAGMQSFAGTIGVDGSAYLNTPGTGGNASVGNGGTGGYGQGGTTYIQAEGTSSLTVAGNATLDSQAWGGSGGSGNGDNIGAGAGGGAQGGLYTGEIGSGGAFALADAAGAILQIGNLSMYAAGFGGTGGTGGTGQAGGAGGNAYGGFAQAGGFDPGFTNPTLGTSTFGDVSMDASAVGGDGGLGDNGNGGAAQGDGGDAIAGGNVPCNEVDLCGGVLLRAKGTVTAGAVTLTANASGGGGTNGGDALGGQSTLLSFDGGTMTVGNAVVHAIGNGGAGAQGGEGQGGTAALLAFANSSLGTGTANLDATGNGGTGSILGGNGLGGTTQLLANVGSTLTLGDVVLRAVGVGGSGTNSATGVGGDGGDGAGGTSEMIVDGDVTTGSLSIRARGFGGFGGNGITGGDGGAAFAGDTYLTINAGGSLTAVDIEQVANAYGGDGGIGSSGLGGDGGTGTGGSNSLFVDAAGTLNANTYVGSTSTTGGYGGTGATGLGDGGAAQGGVNEVTIYGSADFQGVTTGFTGFLVTAFAQGGAGLTGGAATSGTSTIDVYGSLTTTGWLQASSGAQGGEGSSYGGDASGGTASIAVDGTLVSGATHIRTNATGGDGAIEAGDAIGGVSGLFNGGSVTTGKLEILADGYGGNSSAGTGGLGVADFALLESWGSLTATGPVLVTANGEGGDGALGGGDGYGSDAAVRLSGGTATLSGGVSVGTTGIGGSSTGGGGGDGIGGYARLSAYGGNVSTINGLTVDSTGDGGDGVDGGNGYAQPSVEGWGGSVVQTLDDGSSLTLTGQTNVMSNGIGGNGTTGTGGNGTGGSAFLAAIGTPVTVGNALIQANGARGLGGGGNGSGTGGLATIASYNDGSLTGGNVGVQALGSTGGGLVEVLAWSGGDLTVDSLFATADSGLAAGDVLVSVEYGSTADLGTANLWANGGPGGTVTIDIGAAGEGFAGDLLFADSITIFANGTVDLLSQNGAGINVAQSFNVDAAGLVTLDDLTGGAVLSAADITLDGSSVLFDWDFDASSASLIVDGNYTLAGLPTAVDYFSVDAGGSITAGALVTTAFELELIAGTDLLLGNITGTGDIDLEAGGNITFGEIDTGSIDFDAGGTVAGGNIIADVRVSGDAAGAVSLQDITVGPGPEPEDDFSVGITSLVSISVGDVNSYGRVGFVTPGTLTTGAIDAGAMVMALVTGNISTGAITTDSTGIVFMADSSMFIDAGGGDDEFDPVALLAATPVPTGGSIAINGTVNTGEFEAHAGTTLTTLDLVAASVITAESGGNLQVGNASAGTSISLDSGGSISATSLDAPTVSLSVAGDFTTGDLFVDDALLVSAGGNLTAANIVAGGSLGLTAGLNLQTQNLTAGGSLTLNAGGSILTGDLSSGAGIAAEAGTTLTVGNVTSGFVAPPPPPSESLTTLAVVATGEDVILNSGGDMIVENVNSAGGIALNSGGTMTTGALDAATSIAATSAQTMQVLSASAGQDVSLTSGTDFAVGDVDAGGTATFLAGTLASFFGTVSAPTITVTSGGLYIDGEAGLGVSGLTSLITFNAVSEGPVIIGGEESVESGYQLSAEGDISAEAVVVNAVAGNDVILRDLEIEGSATAGGGVSSVTLNTGGSVIVEGAVDYINAGSGDVLAINSGEVIEVITDGGSISMTDSAGNLAGTLELAAHDIWVADQTVIDQLEADPNFSGLETALATNNGTVNPDGYVRAGGVTATMLGSSLLVQNSGTAESPAGLTVGDGGLTVINQGSDPATVIVYGQQTNSDGSVVGGDAFVENVDFSGSGGFSGDSSVNGCDVSGTCGGEGTETPGTGAESILGPIGMTGSTSGDGAPEDSDQEEEEEEEEGEDKSGIDPSVNLINSAPLQLDTTIDEPITSGADSPGGQI